LPTIVNGSSTMFAGAYPETDVVVRPEPLGADVLLQLRSAQAPTTFSWEAQLGIEQELVQLEDGAVAVVEAGEATTEAEEEAEEAAEEEEPEAGKPAPPVSSSSEEGISGEEAEDLASEEQQEEEEATPTEAPSSAPTTVTAAAEARSGEPQPQDTKSAYEDAKSAISYAESKTAGATLMVIEPPEVIDASGKAVPASLSIEGTEITLTLTPAGAEYPITAIARIAGHTDKHSAKTESKFRYGLADDNAATFTEFDPNFVSGKGPMAGHLRIARDVIPYNIVDGSRPKSEQAYEHLIEWLQGVREDKLQPFLAIGTLGSRKEQFCKPSEAKSLCLRHGPTPKRYRKVVKKLLKAMRQTRVAERHNEEHVIPRVDYWGAWNEPDLSNSKEKDPLSMSAQRAARFWEIMQNVLHHTTGYMKCAQCRVVAGEFNPTLGKSAKEYMAEYINTFRRRHWVEPTVWSMHDYHDLVHYGSERHNKALHSFIKELHGNDLTHARIWLAEQGVQLIGKMAGSAKLQGEAAADFAKLRSVAAKYIEVVDYYNYRGPRLKEVEQAQIEHRVAFDSALL